MFFLPDPTQLAARELKEARRELLRAQSALEFASSMVTYHKARIDRLSAVVEKQQPPADASIAQKMEVPMK